MPFTVRLGNPAPVNTHENDDGTFTKTVADVGEQVTEITVGHDDLMAALTEITHSDGVHGNHFADGAAPTWVECDVPALAQMLAAHFGCPIKTADKSTADEGN